jgi:hypothetical protein
MARERLPRIEVHATSSAGEHAAIRVRVGRRVVLDTEWGDVSDTGAMVSALADAIAAIAREDERCARKERRHRRREVTRRPTSSDHP